MQRVHGRAALPWPCRRCNICGIQEHMALLTLTEDGRWRLHRSIHITLLNGGRTTHCRGRDFYELTVFAQSRSVP